MECEQSGITLKFLEDYSDLNNARGHNDRKVVMLTKMRTFVRLNSFHPQNSIRKKGVFLNTQIDTIFLLYKYEISYRHCVDSYNPRHLSINVYQSHSLATNHSINLSFSYNLTLSPMQLKLLFVLLSPKCSLRNWSTLARGKQMRELCIKTGPIMCYWTTYQFETDSKTRKC